MDLPPSFYFCKVPTHIYLLYTYHIHHTPNKTFFDTQLIGGIKKPARFLLYGRAGLHAIAAFIQLIFIPEITCLRRNEGIE
jgi:hypothetical protein